ncbi:glycosyltransferase family 2 protein, partial [Salmonella enterica]|uniref:glycosyltransferase family 2 protein n=1 Tax=Salmonella enterica TaxID=28901 RepID=UPI0032B4FEA9
DVEAYAPEALASLEAQTLTDWIAILVDDASTDGTAEAFARAAAADPRFRLVRLPARVGLGAARNAALALVETPFVAFLDADDVLLPDALERLV